MTIQEIKSNYALELGYLTWGLLLEEVSGTIVLLNHMNEVAKRYATECAKASLEKAADNAVAFLDTEDMMYKACVEKESIDNPDNIVLL